MATKGTSNTGKGAKAGAAAAVVAGAKLAIKYGPQAKIAWDRGGKQAAQAAMGALTAKQARRKALAHAAGLVDGGVLELAPEGKKVQVVLSGSTPVATYPPVEASLEELLAHADLAKVHRVDSAEAAGPVDASGGGALARARRTLRRPGSGSAGTAESAASAASAGSATPLPAGDEGAAS